MRRIAFLLLTFAFGVASAQSRFEGSFVLNYGHSAQQKVSDALLCHSQPVRKADRLALEILDNMRNRGVSKRILFEPADSTWTMLLAINSTKQGTTVKRASLFKGKSPAPTFRAKPQAELKKIGPYTCRKFLLIGKHYSTVVWKTEALQFNTATLYQLLAHCGMLENISADAEWLQWKTSGMILEVESRNKVSGETQYLTISSIRQEKSKSSWFSKEGYKISYIPDGMNCGTVTKE